MQTVFDAPVIPQGLPIRLGAGFLAAYEESGLLTGLPIHGAFAVTHANDTQSGPSYQIMESFGIANDRVRALLLATMPAFLRLVGVVVQPGKIGFLGFLKAVL